MSKKDFIALADMIRSFNRFAENPFSDEQIKELAQWCKAQNYNFKCDRWLDYIAGKCGPSGGEVKRAKVEYQPKTGVKCSCKAGIQRDNCSNCEATGWVIDFSAIRARA